MYMCVYRCSQCHTYTDTHMHIYTLIHIDTCTHLYIETCMHAYRHIHAYTHIIYMYIHIHMKMYMHTHVLVYSHRSLHKSISKYIWACLQECKTQKGKAHGFQQNRSKCFRGKGVSWDITANGRWDVGCITHGYSKKGWVQNLDLGSEGPGKPFCMGSDGRLLRYHILLSSIQPPPPTPQAWAWSFPSWS